MKHDTQGAEYVPDYHPSGAILWVFISGIIAFGIAVAAGLHFAGVW